LDHHRQQLLPDDCLCRSRKRHRHQHLHRQQFRRDGQLHRRQRAECRRHGLDDRRTTSNQFAGIQLNVGTATPSSLQGNTSATSSGPVPSTASTLPGVWTGIYVQSGTVNVGTETGNSIGSGTGTGSVSVTTSATGGTTFGIGATSGGTRVIAKATHRLHHHQRLDGQCLRLPGRHPGATGTNTIAGNTLASATTANSLNAATSLHDRERAAGHRHSQLQRFGRHHHQHVVAI